MKKLFITLIGVASLVIGLQAQPFETATITIPTGTLQTNLLDGACVLYTIRFTPASSETTNMTWGLYDSPLVQNITGGAISNVATYTNAGYYYFSQAVSNMNWLAAGSRPLLGVNSNVNYAGVVTTVTNSPYLSNYVVTVSNNVAGGLVARNIKTGGSAATNTATTVTYTDGIPFGLGVHLTNKSGTAAMLGGYTIYLEYIRPK